LKEETIVYLLETTCFSDNFGNNLFKKIQAPPSVIKGSVPCD
jgi:hypothetical protein